MYPMIRIKKIIISVENFNQENLKKNIAKKIKCNPNEIKNIKIVRLSIDARKKENILYNIEADISTNNEEKILKQTNNNEIYKTPKEEYIYPAKGNIELKKRPIIIGSGPAGLFCSHLLAELGYKPIIIERGEEISKRIKTVETFWKTGKLNENSNVQFGEGGAGTFSDGKLNTLTKDTNNRQKRILNTFVKYGANKDILYSNHPHIGTDMLRNIIINMRNDIIKLGGTFHYNSTLTNIIIKNNKISAIEINNKTIYETDILVLAIGHSARDTFEMLLNNGINIESKPFAVGLRIQHPQEMINKSQYGDKYKLLPPANYKLTYQTKEKRGVYTFCMCPGGYVVNASSEKNRLVINGMSNNKRDTANANSAIIVTVGPKDYGTNPLDGINYQRELEEKMYKLGKGKIPIQLIKDFYSNIETKEIKKVYPIIKGQYILSNLNKALPEYISNSIKEALPNFGKKIKQFNRDDALLAGIESRTSSPVRILRNEDYQSNINGIYPCGEGAGYAGGITTSAIDGLKIAEQIIKKYTINIEK